MGVSPSQPVSASREPTVAAADAPVVGTIPVGFPHTLPLWPGAQVTKTKVTKLPNGKSYSVSTSTSSPYADVLAGIGKGFTDGGWQVAASDVGTDHQKVTILTVSDSGSEGIVTVSQIAGKAVSIDYVVAPKK